MYRLLIVDDEADIVDTLSMYLQDAENMELDVYRAYSAFEALEWLNRTKMDVVLTDIRMPGMNGIQLMENIRRDWPFCKIIFLTGHDEFEYAHLAIKHGGVNYILKTEGYEAVAAAVEKAVAEIEETLQNRETVSQAKLQMEAAIPLMQKEYLQELIQGESYSLEDRTQHFKQLNLPLHAGTPVMLMIARLENIPKNLSWLDKSGMIYSVKFAVEQYLAPAVTQVGMIGERSHLVWFVQPKTFLQRETPTAVSSPIWDRTALFVKETLETLQNICMKTLNVSFSVLMDSLPSPWESIADRYDALKMLESSQLGMGLSMAIVDRRQHADSDMVDTDDHHQQTRIRLRRLKMLEMHLEKGDRQAFSDLLKEVTANRQDAALYYSLSLMFLSYIERWNLTEKLAGQIEVNQLTQVDAHPSWNDAVDYYARLAGMMFKLRFHDAEDRALSAIDKVKEFIAGHYGEDLSLVRLAQVVYFNPSYLSRLFKQVTGTNLLIYINDVRVGHAQKLLRETDLKIHEVAKKVGYMSAPYFTRFFKRAVHMSPQEYRESMSNRTPMPKR